MDLLLIGADPEIQDSSQLKDFLHIVLKSAHLQTPGKPDQLLDKCPEELEENQKCIRQYVFSYEAARRILFGKLHLKGNESTGYTIQDVYCGNPYGKDDFNDQVPGPYSIPWHIVLNAEHTWPQSRFNKAFSNAAQKDDLHHLFPSDHELNGSKTAVF